MLWGPVGSVCPPAGFSQSVRTRTSVISTVRRPGSGGRTPWSQSWCVCPGLGGPSGRRGSASDARACPACACASRARACPWYLSGSRRMALPHLCTQGWGLSGVTRAKPSPRPQTFYSRTSSCPRGGGHMVGVLSAAWRIAPPTYASIHLPGALPLEPAICLVRLRDGGRAVANAPCGSGFS